MGNKIDWFNGRNALNDYDMQEICDKIANVDTPQNLAEVIKGSEQIVVDVAEDNKTLEIHLDAETTADISRSLKTPISAPTTTKLVAVDTTNSQELLTLGTGLTIENGTLNASGGNGEKLYQHCLYIDSRVTTIIINSQSELFTIDSFITYLRENGFTGHHNPYLASGVYYNDAFSTRREIEFIYGILANTANNLGRNAVKVTSIPKILTIDGVETNVSSEIWERYNVIGGGNTIIDTVIEL